MIKKLLIAFTLVTSFAFSQDSGFYIGTPNLATTISAGYTTSVQVGYASVNAQKISLSLNVKVDGPPYYISTAYSVAAEFAAGSSGAATLDIVIPSTIALSSTLPAGQFYQWNLTMLTATNGYINEAPQIGPVTVTATASNESFALTSDQMFVNSVAKKLSVVNYGVENSSVDIYDMTGRKVQTIKGITNNTSYDMSQLNSGVYTIVTSDNKTLKFIL
jgi:hypothetical protein